MRLDGRKPDQLRPLTLIPGFISSACLLYTSQILNLPAGTLAVGAAADIALVDLDCEQTIRVEDFRSKGKNSPFAGMAVTGRGVHTLVYGEWVYRDGNIAPRFED